MWRMVAMKSARPPGHLRSVNDRLQNVLDKNFPEGRSCLVLILKRVQKSRSSWLSHVWEDTVTHLLTSERASKASEPFLKTPACCCV